MRTASIENNISKVTRFGSSWTMVRSPTARTVSLAYGVRQRLLSIGTWNILTCFSMLRTNCVQDLVPRRTARLEFSSLERLNPLRSPKKDGVALLKQLYPHGTHVILSGDTGNGYRAYEMLEALSHVFEKFAFTVELIPLGPNHAWNSSDSRIAHLNIFLRAKKSHQSYIRSADGC